MESCSMVSSGDETHSQITATETDQDTAAEIEPTEKPTASAMKRRRSSVRKPRTKGLVKKLQDQIEFYFGDANLPKDKFLQQKIKENGDGYVVVDTVASFKKMKSLTTDRSLILKAIKNSDMLELSKDSKCLRRRQPLPETSQSDVDSRTVYIENLPPSTADHDFVKKMFRVFGEVKYVSLPRHKTTGDIKGFAFVEFSTQEAVTKAVEYFRVQKSHPIPHRNRKPSAIINDVLEKALSAENMTQQEEDMIVEEHGEVGGEKGVAGENGVGEEKGEKKGVNIEKGVAREGEVAGGVAGEEAGTSEASLDKGRKEDTRSGECVSSEQDVGGEGGVAREEGSASSKKKRKGTKRKRQRSESNDEDLSSLPSKRTRGNRRRDEEKGGAGAMSTPVKRKRGEEEGEGEASVVSTPVKSRRGEEEEEKGDRGYSAPVKSGKEEEEGVVSAPRKRKRGKEEEGDDGEQAADSAPLGKRSKQETKSKAEGGEAKEEGGVAKGEDGGKGEEEQGPKKKKNRQHNRKKQWVSSMKELDLRVITKAEWLSMRNLFKDLQKSHMKQLKAEEQAKKEAMAGQPHPHRGFVKDSLVKVELAEKWEESHRTKLSEFCGTHGDVAYIDMKEGDSQGYVRYSKPGCVQGLLQSSDKPTGMTFSSVPEEGERAYYLKTQAERKNRLPSKKKLKQRGQEKVVSRVLKRNAVERETAAVPPLSSQQPAQQPSHIKFSDSDNSETEGN